MVNFATADLRDAPSLVLALERELSGLVLTSDSGDWYVFYDPDAITEADKRFPFLTVMTGDRYDGASHLDRDDVTYRVNLGVSRSTYESLLGPAPREAAGTHVIEAGADYTDTDTVLPHPFYAPLHWVCIVNPAQNSRAVLETLVEQAHDLAASRYRRS